MLYKTINCPTNPSSDIGGRPKGSPITYAKTCGIVKDFPHAVCTFDDGSFNLNEFLDGPEAPSKPRDSDSESLASPRG